VSAICVKTFGAHEGRPGIAGGAISIRGSPLALGMFLHIACVIAARSAGDPRAITPRPRTIIIAAVIIVRGIVRVPATTIIVVARTIVSAPARQLHQGRFKNAVHRMARAMFAVVIAGRVIAAPAAAAELIRHRQGPTRHVADRRKLVETHHIRLLRLINGSPGATCEGDSASGDKDCTFHDRNSLMSAPLVGAAPDQREPGDRINLPEV